MALACPAHAFAAEQGRGGGGGSDENSDRAGHDGTSAASDTGLECQQKVAHCERVGGHNFLRLTDYLPKLDRHNPYFLLVVGTL